MKTVLLIILAAVSLATSACTSTRNSSYQYSPSYSYGYDSCEPVYRPQTTYFVGPQYYRTSVPYFRNNIRNYTGTPIIAPSACNPHTNIIIPNSWN
jgi:hypothetical protein